jgi:hypothetical protein
MVIDLTDEELKLAEIYFRAAEVTLTALAGKGDSLSPREREAYEAALQYIFVSLDNAPVFCKPEATECAS